MAKARGEVEIVVCEGNRRGGGARGGDGHAISAGIVIGNWLRYVTSWFGH